MEAAFIMRRSSTRRLMVILSGRVAGVIREQDLFFEMERFLRSEEEV